MGALQYSFGETLEINYDISKHPSIEKHLPAPGKCSVEEGEIRESINSQVLLGWWQAMINMLIGIEAAEKPH